MFLWNGNYLIYIIWCKNTWYFIWYRKWEKYTFDENVLCPKMYTPVAKLLKTQILIKFKTTYYLHPEKYRLNVIRHDGSYVGRKYMCQNLIFHFCNYLDYDEIDFNLIKYSFINKALTKNICIGTSVYFLNPPFSDKWHINKQLYIYAYYQICFYILFVNI